MTEIHIHPDCPPGMTYLLNPNNILIDGILVTPEDLGEVWTPPSDEEAEAALEAQIEAALGIDWQDEDDANDALYRGRRPLRHYLMKASDLDLIPPVRWLIEGILPEDALAVFVAEPGAGKSFVALDWAASLVAGLEWQGNPVRQDARVLYIYAEGAPGLKARRDAWQAHHGTQMGDGLSFLIRAANFLAPTSSWADATDESDYAQLQEIVAELRPHLLIVDTMSRAIPGADENDTGTMSLLMDKADQLRELGESMTVLFIHHNNKSGGYRGNSVIKGQINTMVEITEDGILKVTKQKDDQEPVIGRIVLTPVEGTGSVVPTYEPVNSEPDSDTVRRAAIIQLLQVSPQGFNSLFKAVGGGRNDTLRIMKALVAEGTLTQDAQKVYRISV